MNGQTVAYVRVSSEDQNPDRQYELVGKVERIFEDKVSGKARADRPALAELMAYVRQNDKIRIASMDRLARSLQDLLELVTEFRAKGVTVEFVHEGLTFAPGDGDHYAAFQLHVLGAVAELERKIIKFRQAEGIALAKARGVYKGRSKSLTSEQVEAARERIAGGVPKTVVARDLGVSRQTIYSALAVHPLSAPAG